MIDIHIRKMRARDDISEAEEAAVRAAASPVVSLDADVTVIRMGEELTASTVLLEGMMCRYKDLKNGERQITELHLAGDFVDLHSFTLKKLDHSIMTLTPCKSATMAHEKLAAITEQHPHLTRVYWFHTNLDAAIYREWELSLGRRPAIAKLTSLFCELLVRLGLVGLAEGTEYALPLTQTDLAECLGLTQIHVNRTLRELRQRNLVEFGGGRVPHQRFRDSHRDWRIRSRISLSGTSIALTVAAKTAATAIRAQPARPGMHRPSPTRPAIPTKRSVLRSRMRARDYCSTWGSSSYGCSSVRSCVRTRLRSDQADSTR